MELPPGVALIYYDEHHDNLRVLFVNGDLRASFLLDPTGEQRAIWEITRKSMADAVEKRDRLVPAE